MENTNPVINKIIDAEPNTYIIFFVYSCPYSMRALELLREKNVKYKGYDINNLEGGMIKLLEVLNENSELTNFKSTHRTKPIIFINGKFLGGYDSLRDHFNQ
ncbi:glutaredoxin [Tupanvirus deep ocean]|uniref:Glutaredoxin n=2 Tax=Tupanvirus TaxID=2094720 RepID=A0AC62AA56_9VIRU|nr:glutaredoxin [Tupanvirus deep ocean]QKU34634.1 glutaredoxin [Tupanvirus deep ocean]